MDGLSEPSEERCRCRMGGSLAQKEDWNVLGKMPAS
uniref:Uncharacterized protein n=1 Tax=Anguilla anguilla TaxID=7936 RepID=A0A0E9T5Q8_ANGAN